MSEEERLWITLPRFFELGYDIFGTTAEVLWHDLDYNRTKWSGWSSFDPNLSYEMMIDLCELFINRHSALDIGEERIYTQLPTRTFFYTKPVDPQAPGVLHRSLIVRGAIWSNGMIWEEIDQEVGRNLSLLIDDVSIEAFKYENSSFKSDGCVIDLKKRLWEKAEEDAKAIEDKDPKMTESTSP